MLPSQLRATQARFRHDVFLNLDQLKQSFDLMKTVTRMDNLDFFNGLVSKYRHGETDAQCLA